jgi:hypothetical protein
MKERIKWIRIVYIIGIVALVIGALDPLEGSVLITIGIGFISLTTYLMRDRHWKIFLCSLMMVLVGVGFMFFLSSLGGIGNSSNLSWWWGVLIVPYPLGWLMAIITLIVRAFKKPANKPS